MSHSITVSARNLSLRDDMYEFLQRNYRTWTEVLGDDEDAKFYGPFIDTDLSTKGTCRIGFEYDADSDLSEQEYHFALMRWVALQVGKKRSRFRLEGELEKSVPFVNFNLETRPLFFVHDWTDGGASGPLVDRLGMMVDDSVAKELAWVCLPADAFQKVSLTHFGRSSNDVEAAIVAEGIQSAHECLSVVKSQIAKLDSLWVGR